MKSPAPDPGGVHLFRSMTATPFNPSVASWNSQDRSTVGFGHLFAESMILLFTEASIQITPGSCLHTSAQTEGPLCFLFFPETASLLFLRGACGQARTEGTYFTSESADSLLFHPGSLIHSALLTLGPSCSGNRAA